MKLGLKDCIIDKTKHKTIEEQREFYAKSMREMAHGDDDANRWELYGKTSSRLVEAHKQGDIHQRDVSWSPTKQMRTAIDSELSVKEIFSSLVSNFDDNKISLSRAVAKTDTGSKALKIAAGEISYPFIEIGQGFATALQYRVVACPWPLSRRDYFILQDYVLRDQGEDQAAPWLYTINNDVNHPYFAPRNGFVRGSVRNQGLVCEPKVRSAAADADNGGNATKLTWLVNVDLGGSLPSAFATRIMEMMSRSWKEQRSNSQPT